MPKTETPIAPMTVARQNTGSVHLSTLASVLGVAIIAAAGLYWWQVQRAHALAPYIVKPTGGWSSPASTSP